MKQLAIVLGLVAWGFFGGFVLGMRSQSVRVRTALHQTERAIEDAEAALKTAKLWEGNSNRFEKAARTSLDTAQQNQATADRAIRGWRKSVTLLRECTVKRQDDLIREFGIARGK